MPACRALHHFPGEGLKTDAVVTAVQLRQRVVDLARVAGQSCPKQGNLPPVLLFVLMATSKRVVHGGCHTWKVGRHDVTTPDTTKHLRPHPVTPTDGLLISNGLVLGGFPF